MQITEQQKNLFLDFLEDEDTNEKDACLITSNVLTDNFITLDCKHNFNYSPLLEAIKMQKKKQRPLSTTYLHINEIQCPYCRTIHKKLLPFIPTQTNPNRIHGINTPVKYCMKHMTCTWRFKSGARKNELCNNPAYKSECGVFCKTHQSAKTKSNSTSEASIPWNDEMKKLKQFTIIQLKAMLHEENLKKTGNKASLIHRIVSNKKVYTT